MRFQQQDCWTERATDKQRAAARRHDCHTATVKKWGKHWSMCVLLPQSTCKKTRKAKATDGSSHRRRRLYGKILQIYNWAAATDTHTIQRPTQQEIQLTRWLLKPRPLIGLTGDPTRDQVRRLHNSDNNSSGSRRHLESSNCVIGRRRW